MPSVYAFAFAVLALIMVYFVVRVFTAKSDEEQDRILREEEAVATAAGTLIPLM